MLVLSVPTIKPNNSPFSCCSGFDFADCCLECDPSVVPLLSEDILQESSPPNKVDDISHTDGLDKQERDWVSCDRHKVCPRCVLAAVNAAMD